MTDNIRQLAHQVESYIKENTKHPELLFKAEFTSQILELETECLKEVTADSFLVIEGILWNKQIYNVIGVCRNRMSPVMHKRILKDYIQFIYSGISLYHSFIRKLWSSMSSPIHYRILIVLGDLFRYLGEKGFNSSLVQSYYFRAVECDPSKFTAYNKLCLTFSDMSIEGVFFALIRLGCALFSALTSGSTIDPRVFSNKPELFGILGTLLSPGHVNTIPFMISLERTADALITQSEGSVFNWVNVPKCCLCVTILLVVLRFCESIDARGAVLSLTSTLLRHVLTSQSDAYSAVHTFVVLLNDLAERGMVDRSALESFPCLFSELFSFINSLDSLSNPSNIGHIINEITKCPSLCHSLAGLVHKFSSPLLAMHSDHKLSFHKPQSSAIEQFRMDYSQPTPVMHRISLAMKDNPVLQPSIRVPSLVVLSLNLSARWNSISSTLQKYAFNVIIPYQILSILDSLKKNDEIRVSLNKILTDSKLRIERVSDQMHINCSPSHILIDFVVGFVKREELSSDDLWVLKDRKDQLPEFIEVDDIHIKCCYFDEFIR